METWNKLVVDDRSKEDILNEIEEKARFYTPEWKFDRKNPDIGSVIGIIFANQMADNSNRMNEVLEKYHTEFANMYGISLKAARPATTVAALTASDMMKTGTPFYKGTQLLGEDEEGEELIFEAMHDLYVTSARLTDILAVSEKEQKIIPFRGAFLKQNLITGEKEPIFSEEEPKQEIPLFSYEAQGMEEQALLLCHRFLFDKINQKICLKFEGSENLTDLFLKKELFQFYYPTEDGIAEFDTDQNEAGCIELTRQGEEVKQKVADELYSVILLKQVGKLEKNVTITDIEIVTQDMAAEPDFIFDGTKELAAKSFAPFGTRPVIYDECYIGKEPWMSQMGFSLTMNFSLSFEKDQEQAPQKQEPDLRIVKRKSQSIAPNLNYESMIQEVSLEYFNGLGWKRLECTPDISTLFSSLENAGKYSVTFEVPQDWETTSQGGVEERCIRLQVKRADNCYINGVLYQYPVLSDFSLRISSARKKISPEKIEWISATSREDVTNRLVQKESIHAFHKIRYDGNYIFFGFNKKFENGPIGIFFELSERQNHSSGRIEYSYSTTNGFKKLKVSDGTGDFGNSGQVLFMPPIDHAKCELEGVSRYWIRIEDKEQLFGKSTGVIPVIKNIYMNAVEIQNVETGEEQEYFIDTAAANMTFPLYVSNILHTEVWVNEVEQLSSQEMQRLLKVQPDRVKAEYNYFGEIEDFFVKWDEVENFTNVVELARAYVIDRGANQILFGDGVRTRIPQNTKSVAFRVKVTRCSGSHGNLKAGSIQQFRGNLLSIEAVTNPVPAFGGNDLESLKDALTRASTMLSIRRRLVSKQDYIRESMMFSNEISQVACITGKSRDGKQKDGMISLVLLLKDYRKGAYAFLSIEKELKDYMQKKCEITCRSKDLEIVEPVFVKISIRVWLGVKNVGESLEIQETWMKCIQEYLEPVKSDTGSGWKIGTLPKESQIKMMLNTLESDAQMQQFSISAVYQDVNGVHETELDAVKINPFMVCCNGEHQVTINELLG